MTNTTQPAAIGPDIREYTELARDQILMKLPFLAVEFERLHEAFDASVESAALRDGRLLLNPGWVRQAFLDDRLKAALFHAWLHEALGHTAQRTYPDVLCDLQAALITAEALPEDAPKDGLFQEARRRCAHAETLEALAERWEEDDFFQACAGELEALLKIDDHRFWRREPLPEARASGEGMLRLLKKGLRRGVGIGAGSTVRKPQLSGKARHSFRQLLSGWTVTREEIHEDPDEFQTAWYCYGLSRYGNLPMIEPNETREARKLTELAIVIDTSGSCSRGLTELFLDEVCSLMREGLFFRRFRLRILQCDAKVQRDDRIVSLEEFERYIRELTLSGGGGTDFRPAFERIDQHVHSGEFRSLTGVLFFSDGRGIFPNKAPEYETAFVFLEHRYDAIDVPGWVRQVVLDFPKPVGDEYMEY